MTNIQKVLLIGGIAFISYKIYQRYKHPIKKGIVKASEAVVGVGTDVFAPNQTSNFAGTFDKVTGQRVDIDRIQQRMHDFIKYLRPDINDTDIAKEVLWITETEEVVL
jgi:hypothetical protein